MSSSVDPSFLEFEAAMKQFKNMFPNLESAIIESVLRKHDGDVGATIDELLVRSSSDASTSSYRTPSCNSYPEKPPPYSSIATPSYTKEAPKSPQPNTSDDEKIALMLQNEEFLKYLQRDQDFMRELFRDPYQSGYNNRSHHRSSRSSSTSYYDPWEPAPSVPNGPVVDFSNGSIPNGPVVDYAPDTSSSWAGKLKSRLSSRSSSGPRPEDVYPEPAPIVYTGHDENLSDRLKNMSKTSKAKFLALARKFTLMKKDPKMLPTIYGDQTTNFTYDIHHRN